MQDSLKVRLLSWALVWGVVGAVTGNWPFALGAGGASIGVSYAKATDPAWGSWLTIAAFVFTIALIPLTLNPSVGGSYISNGRIDEQGYRCGRIVENLGSDEYQRWLADGRELTPSDPYFLSQLCAEETNGMKPEAWWGLAFATAAFVLALRQKSGTRLFRQRDPADVPPPKI